MVDEPAVRGRVIGEIRVSEIPVATAEERKERRRRGLCADCGGVRGRLPVANELTGRQLRRYGVPVWQRRCDGCGRTETPFAEDIDAVL